MLHMTIILNMLQVALHALIAWVLVEVFVNNAHKLSRRQYVFFHNVSVIAAFTIVFFVYFQFFAAMSVFFVTVLAMAVVCVLELIVFGYLYSGEKWFLNYVDWIFPMFLAMSTIYFVGVIVG